MRADGGADPRADRSFFEIYPQLHPRDCVTPQSKMRRHARLPFVGPMQMFWRDPRGQVQTLRAKCLDLSAEGARLETDTPIPARAGVTLQSARYGSLGTASVRHCVRQ